MLEKTSELNASFIISLFLKEKNSIYFFYKTFFTSETFKSTIFFYKFCYFYLNNKELTYITSIDPTFILVHAFIRREFEINCE